MMVSIDAETQWRGSRGCIIPFPSCMIQYKILIAFVYGGARVEPLSEGVARP